MTNRESTSLTTNLAPRPPLHPYVHRKCSTDDSAFPSPIQEEPIDGDGSLSPRGRSQNDSNQTSDKRSYLKSRRTTARNERRSNIMNMMDRNLETISMAATTPERKTPEHRSPCHPALSKINNNNASINTFSDSQSTLGQYQPPTSQTSTATTATNTSRVDDCSPASSPVAHKAVVHRRSMNIMNIFRRSAENDLSGHSRSIIPSKTPGQGRKTPTKEQGCEHLSKLSCRPEQSSALEKNESVQMVIESYPKTNCCTLEDHKHLGIAELMQQKQTRAKHMTRTKVSQLRDSLESKLRETALLEDKPITDSAGLIPNKKKNTTVKKTKKKSTGRSNTQSTAQEQEGKVKRAIDNYEKDPEATRRVRNTDSTKVSPVSTTRKLTSQHSDGGNSHAESSKCLPAPSPPPPHSPERSSHHRTTVKPANMQQIETHMGAISSPPPTVYHLLLMDTSGHAGFYTGTISDKTSKPHGYGKMTYQTTDKAVTYEGEWNQGLWNGKGRHVKHNGDAYEGDFCDDQKHGTGVYRYKDGKRRFEGRYVMGDRVEGTMRYSDRSVYKGQWYKGKRQGKGVYRFSDNSIYKGDFDEDRIQGMGQLLWPNGSRYVGEWRHGQRHGKGKEYDKDGNVRFKGMWKDNKPLKERE